MLDAQDDMPDVAMKFNRFGRITGTDRYVPNYLGEESKVISIPNAFGLHLPCETHMSATGLTQQRSLCPDPVAGTNSYSRGMASSTEMDYLRKCWTEVFWNGFELGPVVLDKAALDYKELALGTCIEHDDLCARNILLKCAPWDWRDTKVFRVPAEPGETTLAVFDAVAPTLLWVFLGSQPAEYNEKK